MKDLLYKENSTKDSLCLILFYFILSFLLCSGALSGNRWNGGILAFIMWLIVCPDHFPSLIKSPWNHSVPWPLHSISHQFRMSTLITRTLSEALSKPLVGRKLCLGACMYVKVPHHGFQLQGNSLCFRIALTVLPSWIKGTFAILNFNLLKGFCLFQSLLLSHHTKNQF